MMRAVRSSRTNLSQRGEPLSPANTSISLDHPLSTRRNRVSRNAAALDGQIISANGVFFRIDGNFSRIRPIVYGSPNAKPCLHETTIFINGIKTKPDVAVRKVRTLEKILGTPVFGVYNASRSFGRDISQCIGDKVGLGRNFAVDTVTTLLFSSVESNSGLRIIAHSQGALIASRALRKTIELLTRGGMAKSEIEERLGSVQIVTLGGAAWNYPDGPRYKHYLSKNDPVPMSFGIGTSSLPMKDSRALYTGAYGPLLGPVLYCLLAGAKRLLTRGGVGDGAVIKILSRPPEAPPLETKDDFKKGEHGLPNYLKALVDDRL